jgi:hypothetical protein
MARFERSSRPAAGAPPGPDGRTKVKMRLGPDGKFHPVESDDEEPTPETRAESKPAQADDPRPAAFRNIPPFGGAA